MNAVQGNAKDYVKAFIIILNWNGLEDSLECINSCGTIVYPNYRVVLVDNGSRGDDANVIADRFPGVNVLRLETNLGYAGGNNAGIKYALERGADCVWILNNDTVVAADALGTLVDEAYSADSIGCVGSKVLYYDHPEIIWSAGGFYDLKKCRIGHHGFDLKDDGRHDDPADVDYIPGCSVLIKRETIEKLGALRDDFFMFFEDTEFSARLRLQGYRTRYVPGSKVWHKVSRSIVKGSGPYEYYYYRNFLRFSALYGTGIVKPFIVYVKRVFDNFRSDGDWRLARYRIRGIVDFLRCKTGKMD
jgi:hypothetical protein